MEIGTTAPKASNRNIKVEYPFYEKTETMTAAQALEENVKAFGDEVVLSNAVAEMVIKLQAQIRRWLEQGSVPNKKGEIVTVRLTDAEIQEKVKAWKPGITVVRKADPVAAFMASVNDMSPERLLEIVAQLKQKAAAAAGQLLDDAAEGDAE